MKKILLLEGSPQQFISIETTKLLEYYKAVYDYITDDLGRYIADKFYLVSTTISLYKISEK